MPTWGGNRRNLSKEWGFWEAHYKAKGLNPNKVIVMTHRKMRKLYGTP